MFLSAFFSTGRIIFIILFVLGFGAAIVWSYRKDIKNHDRYYKNAGKKVAIYGGLIIAVFLFIRIVFGN
jgi:heme/copper-type cytochrome/quinol oxidase subunit 2